MRHLDARLDDRAERDSGIWIQGVGLWDFRAGCYTILHVDSGYIGVVLYLGYGGVMLGPFWGCVGAMLRLCNPSTAVDPQSL